MGLSPPPLERGCRRNHPADKYLEREYWLCSVSPVTRTRIRLLPSRCCRVYPDGRLIGIRRACGGEPPCSTAVLAMVPETFGVATTSSVAESPLGTLPKVHSTSLPSWWAFCCRSASISSRLRSVFSILVWSGERRGKVPEKKLQDLLGAGSLASDLARRSGSGTAGLHH